MRSDLDYGNMSQGRHIHIYPRPVWLGGFEVQSKIAFLYQKHSEQTSEEFPRDFFSRRMRHLQVCLEEWGNFNSQQYIFKTFGIANAVSEQSCFWEPAILLLCIEVVSHGFRVSFHSPQGLDIVAACMRLGSSHW